MMKLLVSFIFADYTFVSYTYHYYFESFE